jgi:hypothetical protein
MPRYLITVVQEDLKRIRRLIAAGTYRSLDEIVSVAIRNQLIAEEEGIESWTGPAATSAFPQAKSREPLRSVFQRKRNAIIAPIEWDFTTSHSTTSRAIVPDPRDDQLAGTIFWAQYYKFLPLKVATSVLRKMSSERPVRLADFTRTVIGVATRMHQILGQQDSDLQLPVGGRLATSFPSPDEKSQRRFGDQFLIDRRPRSGLLDGFLARSKFANLVEMNGELLVGLSQNGERFAHISNPVLANRTRPRRSLTPEEIDFLVDHLHKKVPSEFSHMVAFLDALAGGADNRIALDTAMRNFYRSVTAGSDEMTDGHVSSMRAGVQSRLLEMGFVASRREGTNATCRITDAGMELLRNGPVTHAGLHGGDQDEGSVKTE